MKVYLVFHCEGELDAIYLTEQKAKDSLSHYGSDAKFFFIVEKEAIE